jgi:hypothetical protein
MNVAFHALMTAQDDSRYGVEIIIAVNADSYACGEELVREFVGREYVGQPIERLDGEEDSLGRFHGFRSFREIPGNDLQVRAGSCVEVSRIRLEFNEEESVERLLEGDVVRVVFDA